MMEQRSALAIDPVVDPAIDPLVDAGAGVEDAGAGAGPTDPAALERAIDAAIRWLEARQEPEGFWVGKLQSNSCMEAEWLLAFHCLGLHEGRRVEGLVQAIFNEQRPDGSWEVYWNAPAGDINTSVECYAALRASGLPASHPRLRAARDWILANGGLGRTRVFTRYWLAMIGEWPWDKTPNIPPELIFLPRWFPFNIYNFASWARATIMPLSILSSRRQVYPLPAGSRLDELFPEGRERFVHPPAKVAGKFTLEWLFTAADRALHAYQDIGVTPARKQAVAAVIEWIVRHQDADGAWGGIQPPWIYSILALHAVGYSIRHPVIAKSLQALDAHWTYEDKGGTYVQASESPVWDTVLSMLAMQDCGVSWERSESLQRAVRWLVDQQVREPGDWQLRLPHVQPGGWAFERANRHYPDADDTAVAMLVLSRLDARSREESGAERALELALPWILAMQSSNGGWAAFDKDNDSKLLTKIPFSDFGEALDPPSVDVTAHVLEALANLGLPANHPAVARALAYVRAEQEPEGCWFGRWGVNYIYGTAAVLPALRALGVKGSDGGIVAAAEWLASCQNGDGGWGEECGSYIDASLKGRGPSTASQTAWALLSLIAANIPRFHGAIERGVAYLLATQEDDGTWDEPHYTGTGFPGYGIGSRLDLSPEERMRRLQQSLELARGFMLNYNMYRHYFPLMALGRARRYFREAGGRA